MTARSRLRWLLVAVVGTGIAVASRLELGTSGTVLLGLATLALAVVVVVMFWRDFVPGVRDR